MESRLNPHWVKLVRFQHQEKMLGFARNIEDPVIAALYGMDTESYRSIRSDLEQQAIHAALQLLEDAAFADRVDRLPFQRGQTVIGVGESTTDDLLSWFEIVGHLVRARRPQDDIRFANEGVSGFTSSQLLGRIVGIVNQRPDWIICMIGGNDAVRVGPGQAKCQVGMEETANNLQAIRTIAAAKSQAEWVWMTPPLIDERRSWGNPYFRQAELSWRNDDIEAIGKLMKTKPDRVVDTQSVVGKSSPSEWLGPDGIHPSAEGQIAIAKRLVEALTGGNEE